MKSRKSYLASFVLIFPLFLMMIHNLSCMEEESDSNSDSSSESSEEESTRPKLTRTKKLKAIPRYPHVIDRDPADTTDSSAASAASSVRKLRSLSRTVFTIPESHAHRVTAWQGKTEPIIDVDLPDTALQSLIRLLKVEAKHPEPRAQRYWIGKSRGTDSTLLPAAKRLGFPAGIIAGLEHPPTYNSVHDVRTRIAVTHDYLNVGDLSLGSVDGLESIGLLERVERLYMDRNFLSAISSVVLAPFINLRLLSLKRNFLTTLPDLSGLPRLRMLYCTQNGLLSLREGKLHACPSLDLVDAEDNEISSIEEDELPPKIEYLFVKGNPLRRETTEMLRGSTTLRYISY